MVRLSHSPQFLLSLVLLSTQQTCVSAFLGALVDQVLNSGLIEFNGNIFSSIFNLFLGRRTLLCTLKFLFLVLTSSDRQFLSDKLRDTSVMTLSEAGDYIGPEAMTEYSGFIFAETSPFVNVGPETESMFYRVLGYNAESDQCEFLWYTLFAYELNQELTEQPTRLAVSSLNTIFLDYSDSFISRLNIFYHKPFLRHYFGTVLNTNAIRDFVCTDVLRNQCDVLDTTTCRTNLESLPVTDGDAYVDGNSLGCRILHAAFAIANPNGHCAHVTLDPNDVDAVEGKLRCSESAGRSPLELFDQATIDTFEEWEKRKGLEPAIGYKVIDQLP